MDYLAKNTKPTVILQLDVGTCVEAGSDPVAWIRANPGRIRSIHCKDWSPEADKHYKVLFGEGAADWKGIFQAAEESCVRRQPASEHGGEIAETGAAAPIRLGAFASPVLVSPGRMGAGAVCA